MKWLAIGLFALSCLRLTAQQGTPQVDLNSVALYFEPNLGQADASTQFVARGAGGVSMFRSGEVLFQLPGQQHYSMRFSGARNALYAPSGKLDGISAYFTSNDQSKWLPSVPHYGKLTATEVYEGVDAVFYGVGSRLEYDLVVKPGADASQIRLAFSAPVRVAEDGSLVMSGEQSTVVQSKPRVYQTVDGKQVEVEAAYQLEGGEVRFELGEYDRTRELVIDPVVVFASAYPGWKLTAVAADANGSVYLAGIDHEIAPSHLAVVNGLNVTVGPLRQTIGFLSKLEFSQTTKTWRLKYATYFPGAIQAVGGDQSGAAHITGTTTSTSFPLVNALPYSFNPTVQNTFMAKLVFNENSSSLSLAYSTILAGADVSGLVLDSSGAPVVGGSISASSPLPLVGPALGPVTGTNATDGFVAKIVQSPSGAATIAYLFRIGGSGNDYMAGIAIDSAGAVHVAGITDSVDFPFVRGVPIAGGSSYVAKIASPGLGASIVYSTRFGARISKVGADSSGNTYIMGERISQPLPPYTQIMSIGSRYVAMLKYDVAQSSLSYGYHTMIPGEFGSGNMFAVTPAGSVFVHARKSVEAPAGMALFEDEIVKISKSPVSIPFIEYTQPFPRTVFFSEFVWSWSSLSFDVAAALSDGSVLAAGWALYGPYLAINSANEAQFDVGQTAGTVGSYFVRIADGAQPAALAVTKSGFGNVMATAGPAAMDCGPVCTTYAPGRYELTATAATGFRFTGWSGACSGSWNSCSVTVDALKHVHATFGRLVPVKLTVQGPGKILVRNTGLLCDSQCTIVVPDSVPLELEPLPGSSSVFLRWYTLGSHCSLAAGSCRFSPEWQDMTAEFGPAPAPSTEGLFFVPRGPCRIRDTREDTKNSLYRDNSIPRLNTVGWGLPSISPCGVDLPDPAAVTLNVTVVPRGYLSYLTVWPAGLPRPEVSTLNSLDGRIKATAAVVPVSPAFGPNNDSGTSRKINFFATDRTDVVVDMSGGFWRAQNSPAEGLVFHPVTPCRVVDTRNPNGPFGGPSVSRLQTRTIPVAASPCGVPSNARAFSLNATVVPFESFSYLTLWPTGSPIPTVSTLNALTGTVTANAAITPAGVNGAIDAFFTNNAHFVLDINGYFAPPGQPGGLKFYPVNPCRISDTRNPNGVFGGPIMAGQETRDYPIPSSACGIPATARAYSLSATVVPTGALGYLTLWPQGQPIPIASTLNTTDGAITSNAAIVPAGPNGAIRAFTSNQTHLILDINGYFAP